MTLRCFPIFLPQYPNNWDSCAELLTTPKKNVGYVHVTKLKRWKERREQVEGLAILLMEQIRRLPVEVGRLSHYLRRVLYIPRWLAGFHPSTRVEPLSRCTWLSHNGYLQFVWGWHLHLLWFNSYTYVCFLWLYKVFINFCFIYLYILAVHTYLFDHIW